MSGRCLALLLLLAGELASAIEPEDVRGLAVSVEPVGESMRVDGVPVIVTSATGRDIEELAARIERRWRNQGSPVQRRAHAGWQLLTRLDAGRSELVQWRIPDGSGELLHSLLDPSRAGNGASAAPFSLPGRCAWGRIIEGGAVRDSFEQRTGHCRRRSADALRALSRSLRAQGWEVAESLPGSLELAGAGLRGLLVVIDDPEGQGSWLSWLGSRTLQGGEP